MVVEKGHRFQNFPNHTQQVEAMVRVMDEAAIKRPSHKARGSLIHQFLESRKKCPTINSQHQEGLQWAGYSSELEIKSS